MLALLRKTYLIALVVLLEKGFTTEFIAAFFSKCADGLVLNTRRAIIYNNLFLFMLTLFFVENCLTLCQLPIST